MKKCPYCGHEFPDEVVRCPIDGEMLQGEEVEPADIPPAMASLASTPEPPATVPEKGDRSGKAALPDRQMRVIEMALVCVVAFGGAILNSMYHFSNRGSGIPGADPTLTPQTGGNLRWGNALLHECASLALLWYVLMRRGKTFYDLGFSWKTKDFGWSILLYLGGGFASYVVYKIITFAGLTSASHATAVASVSFFLFGGGITLATILFQFLNPFFEEMIVRAYVMTELRFQTNSVSKPVIFSTLLQMSYHFYQGAPLAFSLGAGFLVFSIYYSKTNRIAPIILGHLYMDVGGTLYYSAHHQ